MKKILDYFAARRATLLFYVLSMLTVCLLGFLARQEMVYVRYTCVVISFIFVCVLLGDGARYRRSRRRLDQLHLRTELLPRELPEPLDGLGRDYDAIIRALTQENERLKAESIRQQEEQKE